MTVYIRLTNRANLGLIALDFAHKEGSGYVPCKGVGAVCRAMAELRAKGATQFRFITSDPFLAVHFG